MDGGAEVQYFGVKALAIKKEELEKVGENRGRKLGVWLLWRCSDVQGLISNVAFAKISNHVQPPKFLPHRDLITTIGPTHQMES